jgi:hypothetical protein
MAEDRDELLRHYEEMHGGLLAAIDGLDDGALTDPSLDGWSVVDHLMHIAAWDEIRAAEVTRMSAGHATAWRMTGEQDGEFNTLLETLRRGMSVAQARWEIETTQRRLIEAIAAAPPAALDASRYGEAGLRSYHKREHAGWIRRWREDRGA